MRHALLLALLAAPWCVSSSIAQPVPEAGAPGTSIGAALDPETATGQQLYEAACATCHAVDGRGSSPERVGFDTPLPDFSDCNFATREPDADWGAIAHQGGPVRGFDPMMPAFGQALTWEQIQRILGHVRSFCPDSRWPRGELNLPRALITEKAFPEDEAVLTVGATTGGDTEVSSKLVYEKRFGPRGQVEISVPYGLLDRGGSEGWTGGLGDVGVGYKRALYHSAEQGSIFSLTGEVVLPTGDEDDGFGKGTAVIEPFATFGQILPKDAFLQVQAGFELPTDGDRGDDEAFARLVVGRTWTANRFGRAFSPMVEVLAARELIGGEEWQWDVVPQMQWTLNVRQHVMANLGVRLPVTDSSSRDTQVLFYLLWDWFDGGFFEGW